MVQVMVMLLGHHRKRKVGGITMVLVWWRGIDDARGDLCYNNDGGGGCVGGGGGSGCQQCKGETIAKLCAYVNRLIN